MQGIRSVESTHNPAVLPTNWDSGCVGKWALKQVQGDEWGLARMNSNV